MSSKMIIAWTSIKLCNIHLKQCFTEIIIYISMQVIPVALKVTESY